ncbi:hypothetical protein [Thetidibacter halocola]|uniref:Uncharacterized protein n=1 Tax=Thetidibacter halocola TaxID=2827239 RepID=A0A8J7WKB1_9RHOB|nr:hypothetical protein [Thetidibacter halocola]MBS0126893.1 hypothetical protein [Thetidibacter halocola]
MKLAKIAAIAMCLCASMTQAQTINFRCFPNGGYAFNEYHLTIERGLDTVKIEARFSSGDILYVKVYPAIITDDYIVIKEHDFVPSEIMPFISQSYIERSTGRYIRLETAFIGGDIWVDYGEYQCQPNF